MQLREMRLSAACWLDEAFPPHWNSTRGTNDWEPGSSVGCVIACSAVLVRGHACCWAAAGSAVERSRVPREARGGAPNASAQRGLCTCSRCNTRSASRLLPNCSR